MDYSKLTAKELWIKLNQYKKMPQSCTVRRIIGQIQYEIKKKS